MAKARRLIGLEKAGGIMVYDIEEPAKPVFREIVFNRNLDADSEDNLKQAGDLAPSIVQVY